MKTSKEQNFKNIVKKKSLDVKKIKDEGGREGGGCMEKCHRGAEQTNFKLKFIKYEKFSIMFPIFLTINRRMKSKDLQPNNFNIEYKILH